MTASFVVYVDESGDEGFKFGESGGSSKWFVLSAVITEKKTDLQTVKLVDKVREILGRKPDDHKPLHFRMLKHEHRIPLVDHIARADLKTISVCIHKPSIVESETFQQRNLLYYYAGRLLLERVSWYCRDHKTGHTEGDGSAEIVFSNRGGMEYEEFRAYMERLKKQSEDSGKFQRSIDWSVIKSDQITAYADKRMGLQLADAVATSFYYGLQLNPTGYNEDRYVRMLKPVVYNHNGDYDGYGIKIWPRDAEGLIKTESHLMWLKEVYNF